ncbi:MAG: hypothetical protein GWN72_20230 [Nitrospinaceae bacterium]|nr:hypothetical protein [Nitrospinaceae bacterium]NIU98562.1 hypothetical protein [Nitrospinaceae bacterium]NIW61117.1 hypothetical protein [Nitrospinaceae bacterium]
MLSKEDQFDVGPAIDPLHRDSDCAGLFYVKNFKDIADLRRDFQYYFCEGMYTLTLKGPAGTTVTLFGLSDFRTNRGFLILKKKDARMVWLRHLERFPPNQWVTTGGGKDSGVYEAFYFPAPNFRRQVTSVKWGQWWSGETPSLRNDP